MKKTIDILLCVFALSIMSGTIKISEIMAQTWSSVDGGASNGVNSVAAKYSAYAASAVFGGNLYAIWTESYGVSNIPQVHIKYYNGTTWTPAGNTSGQSQLNTSTGDARFPKLVVFNGALYAAWEENESGSSSIHVKRYDGSSWSWAQNYTVGDGRTNINYSPTASGSKVDLAVYNSELYAAWCETNATGDQLRVSKLNSTTSLWTNVSGTNGLNKSTTSHAKVPRLSVHNSKLYVAWNEENASSKSQVRVKEYDGTNWTFIDGNLANGLNYDPAKHAYNPVICSFNNKLYAFWDELNASDEDNIRVKQYDATNGWTNGADGGGWNYGSNPYALNPSCYAYGGKIYVAWNQIDMVNYNYQIRLVSFDGTTKSFIDGNGSYGINQNNTRMAYNPNLVTYNGDLYAIWHEDKDGSDATWQIRAKKYPLPPIVESVAVPANATYATGQAMDFIVNFSKVVNVSGGTPYIPITLNTGGTVNATYVSGSPSKTLLFRYTVVSGNEDTDGITVGSSITLPGGCTLRSSDASPLDAGLTLYNTSTTASVKVDAIAPTITGGNIASNNNYIDVTFSEGVYGAANGSTALTASGLSINFIQNSGTATNAVISSVKKNDNAVEGSASALTGGETTVRVFLSITGTPNGLETIEIKPTNATSVYDGPGNAASASQTTGVKNLNDNTPPTLVSVSRTDDTHLVVTLSKNCVNITKANNGGFVLHQTGQPTYTYTISSIAQGIDASHVVLTTEDFGACGMEGLTIKYTAGGNGTIQDNLGNAMATNSSGVTVAPWDVTAPTIVSATLASNNSYIDITFSEGVYGTSDGVTPLSAAGLSLTFIRNGGTTTTVVISSVKRNNNTSEGSALPLSGGETIVRVFLSITGNPKGVETIEIKPANGTSVYDKAGNAAVATQTTGTKTLNDKLAPTMVSAVRMDDTHIIVTLSENCVGLVKANDGGFTVFETGAPGTIYAVPSIAQDVDASHVKLTVANMAISAKEGVTVTYQQGGNGTIGDLSSNNNPMATNSTGIDVAPWDQIAPVITSATLASDNSFIDINFSEGVYGAANGIDALTVSKLSIIFAKNTGGNATIAVISSVKKNDNTVEGSASALTGGETTVRAFLSVTGIPSGMETIEIKATDATSVFDKAGNSALVSMSTGSKLLNDKLAPTVSSITRLTPSASLTNATTVVYRVTFSESVSGLDASNFSLTASGVTGNIASVSSSTGTIIDITVNNISGNGTLRLDLKSSGTGIYDASGNVISGGFTSGESYTLDQIVPSVTISSSASTSTNISPIPVTITFSEAVTGFVVGDITVSNGTASGFSGGGASYTVNITPSGQGTVTVDVASGVATDAAGNNNTAASQLSRIFDNIAPTVSITSTSASSTNVSPIPVTITFSEAVTGFIVGDITVSNGTASGFSGSGASYTVNITPSGQGTVTVNVASGVATDAAGNNNSAATQLSRIFDNIAPTVSITSTSASSTNVSPIPVTIAFSEAVTGFVIGDITVSNGTASGFSGSGASYTVNITPSGQGTVTVDVAAGVATDVAGNNNSAATQLSRIFDNIAPTVSITSTSASSTNVSPIPVTITFSEAVTGFVVGDITVSNGTASGFNGSGASYTVNITPSGQGTVTVDVASGVAIDAAGNNNSAATQLSRIFDNVSPTVSITSTSASSTNVSPIPVTITFSEAVTGFVVGDITVSNGTASGFSGSGASYTVNITPSGQGTVTVDVAAGVATDAAGNNNSAATQLSRIFDNIAPTVSITSTSSSSTNVSPIPVTITFSEAVTGFVVGDITVSNGTASGFSGTGASYTVNITPSGQGTVTVNVASGVATDAAGNNNSAATQLSRIFDNVSPTVSITSTSGSSTNVSPIPVTITFSEAVTGFVVGDITVSNGTASGFSGSGASYTVNITPSGQGTVTVDVAAGVATDAAGNNNSAATQLSRIFDNIAPTVSITSTSSSSTNVSPIPVTITFSEAVTGFVVGDITVSNGTASGFSGSGASYTVNITPSGQGTVTVDVASGVAIDAAGNNNSAATQLSRIFDNVSPTVSITSTSGSSTNVSSIPVIITFSEPVTGFDASDIIVVNGTKGVLNGSGTTYTINITPSAQGIVTIDIGGNAAQDGVGNGNITAPQFSRIYDTQPPSVTLASTVTSPTNISPIPVIIKFNEYVTGFDAGDITLSNATKGSFSGSGDTYSLNIIPSGQGLVSVNIVAGISTDAAGNLNTASATLSWTFDNVSPSVTLSSIANEPTNSSVIPVTITFSEAVTGFDISDITVTNGVIGTLNGNGSIYTLDIIPSSQGVVTVSVPADLAVDAAGNTNSTASPLSRTFDNVAPSVSITSTTTDPTNTSPISININFSEAVTGFGLEDISVSNGTKSSFSGSGSSYTLTVIPSAPGLISVNIGAGVASDVAGNANVAATPFQITYVTDYLISGNIGLAGVTLGYTNGSSMSAVTNNNGEYIIVVPVGWNGTITPEKDGFYFTPSSRTFTNVLSNQTLQNYSATAITYTISGNTGVAGATLNYTDGSSKTVTSDGTGNYSFAVSWKWSGTVSVAKVGYTFSADKVYSNILSNQTLQDYTATAITYTISGNAGVVGATLSYTDGTAKTTVAGSDGNYSFTVSYNWSGTVSASKEGYTFSADRVFTNVLSNQSLQDYTATAITYTISGNAGVAGATLHYTDGTAKTTVAGSDGNYSFTVSYNWSGTVSASKEGYTFSTDRVFTNVLSNQSLQDYTATAISYTISGNAGVAGATLSYTDGTAKTTVAGSDGNYSFTVSYNWSGTVSASKAGYTFSADRVFTHVLSDQNLQDYTATAITFIISGNAGVAGAILSYTDETAKTVTADNEGNYSFTVCYDWSGTVTPSKTGYTFNPINILYSNVLSAKTAQNFTATNSTDVKIVSAPFALVTVYPTVNEGSFKIDMTNPEQGKVTVKIISISGLVVKEFRFIKSLKEQTFEVNMNRAVNVGSYMVEMTMEKYTSMQRIVIR